MKKRIVALLVCCLMTVSLFAGTALAAANDVQIVDAGGTLYYDANGGAVESSAIGSNGAVIRLDKIVTAVGEENVFDITLGVQTSLKQSENFAVTPDSAVVLTIDMSGTMYNNKMDSKRYVDVAKEKANDFVESYAASTENPDAKRLIAVVCFDTDAKVQLDWTDVNTASGLSAAKTAINNIKVADNGNSSSKQVCTNFDGGMILTRNLLTQPAPTGADKRFAIILSDGAPTVTVNADTNVVGTIKSSFWGEQKDANGVKYQNAHRGGGWTHPAEVDRTLGYLRGVAALTSTYTYYADSDTEKKNPINHEGIFMVGVGGLMSFKLFHDGVYGTANGSRTDDIKNKKDAFNHVSPLTGRTADQIMNMTTGDWMTALADAVGGTYVSATDSAALASAFSKIKDAIAVNTWIDESEAWNAVDPVGAATPSNVDFLGFYGADGFVKGKTILTNDPDGDTASVGSNVIDWDLKNSTYTESADPSGMTIYTYSIKYRVRLMNEVSGFVSEQAYDTNGRTTFSYQTVEGNTFGEIKTVDFPIPAVKGYLGDISFTKVDEAEAPLAGAVFTLSHDADCCSIRIADRSCNSDANGAVSFAGIPSAHRYTLSETTAPDGYLLSETAYPVSISYGVVTFNRNGGTIKNDPIPPEPTPTPSADPTPTPTPTPSADPTPTPTPTPSADPTPTPTPTPSADPTPTPTPNPSADPTPTPSPTPVVPPTLPPVIPMPTPTPGGDDTIDDEDVPLAGLPNTGDSGSGFLGIVVPAVVILAAGAVVLFRRRRTR